jgi:DNA polymerase-3 subunit gamma/tau
MVLALYRRFRPSTLLTVIGQEHVTEPLARAIDSDKI